MGSWLSQWKVNQLQVESLSMFEQNLLKFGLASSIETLRKDGNRNYGKLRR